jgi:cytochrome P450
MGEFSGESFHAHGPRGSQALPYAWAFVRSLSLGQVVLLITAAVLLRVSGPDGLTFRPMLVQSLASTKGADLCFPQFLVISVYRLTLHPLAKYPGPFLNKISDWPLVHSCYRGNRHIWEYFNHAKYGGSPPVCDTKAQFRITKYSVGPIVRYGPNSLSFNTPTALQAIHGPKANIKKGAWYLTLDISAGAPSVQMVRDKQEHKVRRKFISPAFSEKSHKDAEPLIAQSVLKLCDRLMIEGGISGEVSENKGWSNPIDFNEWATYYGYDFISDLAFGMSFNMLEDEETRYIPGLVRSGSQFIYAFGYLPIVDYVRWILGTPLQNYVSGAAKDTLKFTNLASQRLADRMEAEDRMKKTSVADPTVRKDIFHYLLNSDVREGGRKFSIQELQADASLLISAGSDGVALTLAATMFYLLRYPKCMDRVVREIRSAFQDPSEICNPQLSALPYLHGCMEEMLRLNPPKPSATPREVLKGGMDIDGHHIPAGTDVGIPTYALHHDASIFPEPWSFRPERWIVDADAGVTAESVARAKSAFLPFIIGPMNCIGKTVAYTASKLALAHILWRYDVKQSGPVLTGGGGADLELGRNRPEEYQMMDWVMGFRDGPLIELRERATTT